jgi:hypothetical protein
MMPQYMNLKLFFFRNSTNETVVFAGGEAIALIPGAYFPLADGALAATHACACIHMRDQSTSQATSSVLVIWNTNCIVLPVHWQARCPAPDCPWMRRRTLALRTA